MNTFKRLGCFVLTLVLCLGLFPGVAMAAPVTASDIQAKIDAYYSAVSKDGQPYWNKGHGVETLKKHADEGDYAADISLEPCQCKYHWDKKEKKNVVDKHYCTSNKFTGGSSQCHGFGKYMCYVIFGSSPADTYSTGSVAGTKSGTSGDWTTYKKGNEYPGVQAGDLIRRRNNRGGWHTVVVRSVSSNGKITVINANHTGNGPQGACDIKKGVWNKITTDTIKTNYNEGRVYICRYKGAPVQKDGDEEQAPSVTATFSNYQVRKLTQTSAEPYATVNSTGAKVTEVGMYIGESEKGMVKLGSDNGKASWKKNMWYNTTKYGYELQPGTTYYYRPYAVVDNETYEGNTKSFTTPGTKPTQSKEEPQKACSHSYNSVGHCGKCGQVYPMPVTSLPAKTYEAVKNDVPVRNRPYAPEKIIRSLSKGERVSVVASGKNSQGNLWYKLDNGTWVYSKNLTESKQSADCSNGHTKGAYQFCEAVHPHDRYWKCANCGALFTDGSTQKLDSCEICNPKPSPVTFYNYKVRKLTATSAEPYATAKTSEGKVARVGMMIGTSKGSLTELGTDNGTPKPLKNMWYNTKKYKYPLQPGTTYYYQPFAEVNGKRYFGEIRSFTTPSK